jgi:hypothetical protein
VWGTSGNDVFAVGSDRVFHFDGAAWVLIPILGADLYGVWGSGPDDAFSVGLSGDVFHYDGVFWTGIADLGVNLFDVWGNSSSNAFTVGTAGSVFHFDGTTWNAYASGTTQDLYDVWVGSTGVAFAVGANGTVVQLQGNRPPSAPSNPSPPDGTADVALTPTLSWTASDPDGDPLMYDLYFGSISPPETLLVAELSTNSFTIDVPLDSGTTYYWRVVANDGGGLSTQGPEWRFTTLGFSDGGVLRITDATGFCNATHDTVTIDLVVEGNPGPIKAAGTDIVFDPSILALIHCERGDLTAGWAFFGCNTLAPGHVRIGGFDEVALPAGTNGTFARLTFVSNCCDSLGLMTSVCPTNPVDDFLPLALVCGQFDCQQFLPDGDVNDDGFITPADASCALDIYLNGGSGDNLACAGPGWAIRSDVNCDEQTTPEDARLIFDCWLSGGVQCEFCGTAVAEAPPARVMFGRPVVTGNEVTVPVRVAGVPELDALGFEVDYPANVLEFVSVDRTSATRDFVALEFRSLGGGRLRVGGFSVNAVDALNGVEALVLRFRLRSERLSGALAMDRFVDDVRAAARVVRPLEKTTTPRDFELSQNHPNPFNPVTEIQYRVPYQGDTVPVSLVVYDVTGRRVRTLVNEPKPAGTHRAVWDARDNRGNPVASGIYFYVMKAGEVNLKKKMILLR